MRFFIRMLALLTATVFIVSCWNSEKTDTQDVVEDSGPGNDSETGGDSDSDNDTDVDADVDNDTDVDVDVDNDADIDGDSDGDTDYDTDTGDLCEEEELVSELVKTRIMLLIDVSQSMDQTKMDEIESALDVVWKEQPGSLVELGLDVFPDDGLCGVNQPVVNDCKMKSGGEIAEQLALVSFGGDIPLYNAMKKISDSNYAPNFSSSSAASFLVIMVNGADNCLSEDASSTPATPEDFAKLTEDLLNNEIETAVVSLGQSTDSKELEAIAVNGGTGLTVIETQTQQSIEAALTDIYQTAARCVFEIEDTTNTYIDRDAIDVYIDEEYLCPIKECSLSGNGWVWIEDLEKNWIELCEDTCEKLRKGEIDDIFIGYGCSSELC
ncbi:MAG: VWA domain-containing protein [Deltaproteobacteria bacterium]|nr:VWA domain-containing protein [Deltaproteobacteria bacterium]